jgi:spore maturation protein CgeB
VRILYSFNKRGFEAGYWSREIAAASDRECEFIPFNHDRFLSPAKYLRAQRLDDLYFEEHPGLFALYAELRRQLIAERVDALIVDNCPPYHPEFLRTLPVYKVLRIADGPMSAYDRDFAYLHAYDHVLYHSPAYSRDLGMAAKLKYCGARRCTFWPLASFEAMCDRHQTEATILRRSQDIDVIFIGALHVGKMPFLAAIKKALGRRLRLYGLAGLKKNAYFNLRFGFPGWVRPVPFEKYVSLYQRAKIGINVHNRGDFTVGSYRLFDLPANGVMQISDGGSDLETFFRVDEEVVRYQSLPELAEKVEYYLEHDAEREHIALNGFRRVRRDYRIGHLLRQAAAAVAEGIHA